MSLPIHSVHGNLAPANVPWTPAGPFMNNLLFQVYSGQDAEFTALQSNPPQLDLTDWPLPASLIPTIKADPRFLVTSPVSQFGMFELDLNNGATWWGIPFNFGNNPAGVHVRQGIAHLVDKDAFIASQLGGLANKIDNPAPPAQGLPSPNVCAWDSMFPTCTSAYKIQVYSTIDGMVPVGSPDFCAAADHFIAAGLATGKDASCVLTGLSSAAASQSIVVYGRSDDPPRLALGTAIASEIGKLMGRSSAATLVPITIQQASRLVFSGTTNWSIYTGGWSLSSIFDQLYSIYNSIFASTACGGKSSSFPSNYVFVCNPTFDALTNMLEFNTTLAGATTSAINAEDVFGRNAFTIPVYSSAAPFAYLNGWTGVNNQVGVGIPNYFTWLNAWQSTPPLSGTIRQGMKQGTSTLNIYNAATVWEFYILSEVYDSLLTQNPANPSQLMGWMANNWRIIAPASLGYTPPAGTIETLRFQLRNDIYWHDGVQVTANDVKFTMISFRDAPAVNLVSSVQTIIDATVLSNFVVDIHLGLPSPFAELNIGTVPIVPQHIWAAGGTGFVADTAKTSKFYDPVTSANNALIGSGPFICASGPLGATGTVIGGGCTSSGISATGPGSTILLQRNGLNTGHSPNTSYFRSSFNLKQWIWADNDNSGIVNIFDIAAVATCFGKNVTATPTCSHWDAKINGIGGNGDGIVDIIDFASAARWFDVRWVYPYTWTGLTGVQSFPPTVYEGSIVYP